MNKAIIILIIVITLVVSALVFVPVSHANMQCGLKGLPPLCTNPYALCICEGGSCFWQWICN